MSLIPEDVKSMIDNYGVYLCGDILAPDATVPIVSMNGKLFSLKIDDEMDPERFRETLTIAGPFHKAT